MGTSIMALTDITRLFFIFPLAFANEITTTCDANTITAKIPYTKAASIIEGPCDLSSSTATQDPSTFEFTVTINTSQCPLTDNQIPLSVGVIDGDTKLYL